MACSFTSLNEPNIVQATDQVSLQNAINSAGSAVTQIDITSNITLSSSIDIPVGSRIIINGVNATTNITSGVPNSFQLIAIHSSATANTIFHLKNIQLSLGGGNINGGGIGSNEEGFVEVVVEDGSTISSCVAPNGGGIFVRNGAVGVYNSTVTICSVSIDGGGIYAPCVELRTAEVSRSVSGGNGGGVYTTDYTQSNSILNENNAGNNGGGLYLNGSGIISGTADSQSFVYDNLSGANGAGIYLSNQADMSDTFLIQGNVTVGHNDAAHDGGGVWVDHSQLARLSTTNGVIFTLNTAQASVTYRQPSDDAVYYANIHSTVWTSPFTQGYNNFDIAYDQPDIPPEPEDCRTLAERLIDIALPVSVRPFATVGNVVSRCCGPATIVPGFQIFPPDDPENCDFTIHQRVCVQVPVEFGATVEVGNVHSECTGESCDGCDE